GWDQQVEENQQPLGLGIHSLLAHEEVESVTFASNLLALTVEPKVWWNQEQYFLHWQDNLRETGVSLPGLTICVTCSKKLTESLLRVVTGNLQIPRSPAHGYHHLLTITLNYEVVSTKIPRSALPEVPLIETQYQNNRLTIGLHDEKGYPFTAGLAI